MSLKKSTLLITTVFIVFIFQSCTSSRSVRKANFDLATISAQEFRVITQSAESTPQEIADALEAVNAETAEEAREKPEEITTIQGAVSKIRSDGKTAKTTAIRARSRVYRANPGRSEDAKKARKAADDALTAALKDIDRSTNESYHIVYDTTKYEQTRWFPAKNSIFCRAYYNGGLTNDLDLAKEGTATFSTKFAAISNDVITAYWGAFQVSMKTVISRETREVVSQEQMTGKSQAQITELFEKADSANRANNTFGKVLAKGGELGFSFRTPMLNVNGNFDFKTKLEIEFAGLLSGDFPTAGSYVTNDKFNGFGNMGLNIVFSQPLTDYNADLESVAAFNLFAKVSPRVIGGTKYFYENLGISKSVLAMIDTEFGVVLWSNFKIIGTYQYFSDDKLNENNDYKLRWGIGYVKTVGR